MFHLALTLVNRLLPFLTDLYDVRRCYIFKLQEKVSLALSCRRKIFKKSIQRPNLAVLPNVGISKHAESLSLSVLKLNRFYSLFSLNSILANHQTLLYHSKMESFFVSLSTSSNPVPSKRSTQTKWPSNRWKISIIS